MMTTGSGSSIAVQKEIVTTGNNQISSRKIHKFIIPLRWVERKEWENIGYKLSAAIAKEAGVCHIVAQGLVSYYPGDTTEATLHIEAPLADVERHEATHRAVYKNIIYAIFNVVASAGTITHIYPNGNIETVFNPKSVLT